MHGYQNGHSDKKYMLCYTSAIVNGRKAKRVSKNANVESLTGLEISFLKITNTVTYSSLSLVSNNFVSILYVHLRRHTNSNLYYCTQLP